MTFRIITADQRLASQTSKGQIWGKAGIGKTSLLWGLDPAKTLVGDMEAGLLSVQGWGGDHVTIRSWPEARDFACLVGGPNPAQRDDQPYSLAQFNRVASAYESDPLAKYDTVFVDSTTIASRHCLQWAQGQPEAFSEKSGKPDMRGAYGLLGREMLAWATQLHHSPKNVWLVGGLEQKEDDFGRKSWSPLIDGNKAATELPYLVDQVITMAELKTEDGTPYRAFVCQTLNPYGYPAKDRSGRLDMIEEPHLGRLMEKIRGAVKPAAERLTYAKPEDAQTADSSDEEQTERDAAYRRLVVGA